MARSKDPETGAVQALPRWVLATIERDDSFRFEAIGLLEQARARLAAAAPDSPASGGATAVAALHLANKALLAARGYRSLSYRGTEDLLGIFYGRVLPREAMDRARSVAVMKLQGAGAVEAAGSYVELARKLL